MSLFGAMNTAISGLNAQSAAFANIGDNVANSQTVGFKGTDTSFADYLTTSSATVNDSGSVVATPLYQNNVQGTVTTSTDTLALAISGQGFFNVSKQVGSADGKAVFGPQQEYTRTGDWNMNKDGYLVNSSGNYLNGWTVDGATGAVDRSKLVPIQINQSAYNPTATSKVALSANLPATPSTADTTTSQIQVYDSLGKSHTVNLNWVQNADSDWTVSVQSPDANAGTALGTASVKFGSASGNAVTSGTLGALGDATGAVTATPYAANGAATLTVQADFGQGAQPITLDLGTYGGSTGLTQYAGTQISQRSLSQDGIAPGAFSSVSTKNNGDIQVNYDNGQSRTVAHVPLTTFTDPNALQRQDGQAFTATAEAGNALTGEAGADGAGSLVTQSVESSNVDIASQFTRLIVAQRAYSANTKVVTTADDMLQQTIDMKR